MLNMNLPAPVLGSRRAALVKPRLNLLPSLFLSVAAAALLAGTGATMAEDFVWGAVEGAKADIEWENPANWLVGGQIATRAPGAGDTLTISSGTGSMGTPMWIDTLNHEGADTSTSIGHYGVVNVGTFNLIDGKYKQSNGGPMPQFPNGPPGITNVSTLLNITGGSLAGQGLVNVGPSGTVKQSGGNVAGAVTITTPSYAQSGGTMVGNVTTSTYGLTGTGSMSGTVNLDTQFTLSDDAVLSGTVKGDGDATMIQSGGSMNGWVEGMASYTQLGGRMGNTIATDRYYAQGGSLAGEVDFSELFALSGDDTSVEFMNLVGARDAVMTQSGGTMDAFVYNDPDNYSAGIAAYRQSGGTMGGTVIADTYELSGGTVTGSVNFANLFDLSANGHAEGILTGDGDATITQSGGIMEAEITGVANYNQSGGTMNSALDVDKYTQSGGAITSAVNTNTYELAGGTADGFDNVTIASTLLQSGGHFDRDVNVPIFTQSGGLFSGSVNAQTYNLTGAGATSTSGSITASDLFNLAPASGTATVDARLSGTGNLVKSGASTVILTNSANNFSGTVTINAGILNAVNDALPEAATVTIGADAALQLTTNVDTTFTGSMSGKEGDLIKDGAAAATLSGTIDLGDLWLNAGRLNIGTGTSTNEATFETADIARGATLYIAQGATLTIRLPKHIVNNGTLINDGTVHDDLDNHGMFDNNQVYNADVASNTGTINNNTPGAWTGDVLTNAGTINNDVGSSWHGDVISNTAAISNNGAWTGDVRGNGTPGVPSTLNFTKLIYNDYTATWTGDIEANDSWILNQGGTWTGDILSNNGQVWNDNRAGEIGTGYWIGDVVGNAGGVFNGGGGDWHGDVLGNASSGYIKNDAPAVWTGKVFANDGRIENRGLWTGDIVGNAGLIINEKTWAGDVAASGNTGAIINTTDGVWTGDVLANSGTITTLGTWNGDVTTAGTVNAEGLINGDVTNTGLLQVTGALSGIAALTNNGTLEMRGGGVTQTLSVATASFGAGSTLGVDVDGTAASDSVTVTGNATLGGALRVSAAPGAHGNGGSYTVLTAGTYSGAFASVTTDLAFMAPHLTYGTHDIDLALQRNNVGFASTGTTANQQSVGGSVEALAAGNPIYDAVLWLTPEQAQNAFDQLSGETYASAGTASIQGAGMIQGVVQTRIDQAFDALGDTGDAASGYAGDGVPLEPTQGQRGIWGQAYGTTASSTAGAAPLDAKAGGLVAGTDAMLGDWRLGALLQLGATSTAAPTLNSSVESTDYGTGVYAGINWGATRLSLGGGYTLQDTKSERTVAFPGFSDTLSANYLAGTAQAFAKLSHEFDLGAVSLTPYAGLAQVRYATEGFTESGGPASLSRAAQVIDATFATLGLGVDRKFVVGGDMLLTAKASLGWRHAFASDPSSVNSLAAAPAFSVAGAPIASDLAVLSAGLTLDVNAATNLDLSYDGQIGGELQTHTVKATWAMQF